MPGDDASPSASSRPTHSEASPRSDESWIEAFDAYRQLSGVGSGLTFLAVRAPVGLVTGALTDAYAPSEVEELAELLELSSGEDDASEADRGREKGVESKSKVRAQGEEALPPLAEWVAVLRLDGEPWTLVLAPDPGAALGRAADLEALALDLTDNLQTEAVLVAALAEWTRGPEQSLGQAEIGAVSTASSRSGNSCTKEGSPIEGSASDGWGYSVYGHGRVAELARWNSSGELLRFEVVPLESDDGEEESALEETAVTRRVPLASASKSEESSAQTPTPSLDTPSSRESPTKPGDDPLGTLGQRLTELGIFLPTAQVVGRGDQSMLEVHGLAGRSVERADLLLLPAETAWPEDETLDLRTEELTRRIQAPAASSEPTSGPIGAAPAARAASLAANEAKSGVGAGSTPDSSPESASSSRVDDPVDGPAGAAPNLRATGAASGSADNGGADASTEAASAGPFRWWGRIRERFGGSR